MSTNYSNTILAEKILSAAIEGARKKLNACPLPSTLEEVQAVCEARGEFHAYQKAYELLIALSAEYSDSYKELYKEVLELRGSLSYYKNEYKRLITRKRIGY